MLLLLLARTAFVSFVAAAALRVWRAILLTFVILMGVCQGWILEVTGSSIVIICIILLAHFVTASVLVHTCVLSLSLYSGLCLGQSLSSSYSFLQLSAHSSLICASSICNASFLISCSWIDPVSHLLKQNLLLRNRVIAWIDSGSCHFLSIFNVIVDVLILLGRIECIPFSYS